MRYLYKLFATSDKLTSGDGDTSFFLFFFFAKQGRESRRDSDNGGNKVCNVTLSCDNIEMQFLDDG